MKATIPRTIGLFLLTAATVLTSSAWLAPRCRPTQIVHDAEYYILDAQNGETWKVQDKDLDAKLAELKKKFGRTPNIVQFMWDDQPFGAVGIPAMQPMRGYSTPNLNKMAAEGMLFTRMYSEPSCTPRPSRAALMTGQTPFRNGMSTVGMPIENKGLGKNNVTIANVLSKAGYATGFFGKWHLGDIEQSYPYNQGFDEALFSSYNQIDSLWNVQGEAGGAVEGMFEQIRRRTPTSWTISSSKGHGPLHRRQERRARQGVGELPRPRRTSSPSIRKPGSAPLRSWQKARRSRSPSTWPGGRCSAPSFPFRRREPRSSVA